MYYNYKNRDEAAMKEAVLDAGREYKRAKQRRTAAAFVDFATNLLSLVGRNKGLRYNVAASPITGKAANSFEKAQERYRRALIDYKGVIAENNLKKSIADNRGTVSSTSKMKFLTSVPYSPINDKSASWKKMGVIGNIRNIKKPVWHINNKK